MSTNIRKGPTIRYGYLQAGYWINYLIIASFAAVFLEPRGFSTKTIGTLTAGASLVSCFLQHIAGTISDRYQDRIPLKYITAMFFGACVLCFLGLQFLPHTVLPTFVFYFTALSLQAAITPLLSALCLQFSNRGYAVNFGLGRSMGSLGYALCGLFMGHITDAFGTEIILPVYIGIYAIVLFVLLTFPVPQKDAKEKIVAGHGLIKEEPSSMKEFVHSYHRFLTLICGLVFVWFGNSLLSTYMIYFMKDIGGTAADMSTALGFMAACEIPAVMFGNNIMARIGADKMLRISAAGGVIKAVLLAIAWNVPVFIAFNAMHFFLSGFYQVSVVYYVYSIVGEKDIVKGQALLGIAVSGIAAMLANWAGGILLESVPHRSILWMLVLSSTIGLFIVWIATDPGRFRHEVIRRI